MNFIGKNEKKVSFGAAHENFDSNLRKSTAKSIKIGSKIQAKRYIFALAGGRLGSGKLAGLAGRQGTRPANLPAMPLLANPSLDG